MNRPPRARMVIAAVAGFLLSQMAFAGTALAKATSTPFTATAVCTTTIDPGTFWVSGNIGHIRNMVVDEAVTGDLVGTLTVVENDNFAIGGLQDETFGTFTLVTSTTTYTGTFAGGVPPGSQVGSSSGTLEAQGTDGTKWVGTTFAEIGDACAFTLQGTILDPHG
jgi:hypothetical protein